MSLKKMLDEQKRQNQERDKFDELERQKQLARDDANLIEEIALLDDEIEDAISSAIIENHDFACVDISADFMLQTAAYGDWNDGKVTLNTKTIENPRPKLIAKYKEMGIDLVFEWYKYYDTECARIHAKWKKR